MAQPHSGIAVDGSVRAPSVQDVHASRPVRPRDDRLHAYLASALTGLTPDERTQIFATSDLVARVCADEGIDLYEPRKSTDPVHHSSVPDWEVFRLDRQRVVRSDLLIYLADRPSTGAGQELVFAQDAVVPILILAQADMAVSRMVTGMPKSDVLRYLDLGDLADKLSTRLGDLTAQLVERRMALADYAEVSVGGKIRELRERRGMSHEDVARATRVRNAFTAEQLALWETSTDLESGLDLILIREIAYALDANAAELI